MDLFLFVLACFLSCGGMAWLMAFGLPILRRRRLAQADRHAGVPDPIEPEAGHVYVAVDRVYALECSFPGCGQRAHNTLSGRQMMAYHERYDHEAP